MQHLPSRNRSAADSLSSRALTGLRGAAAVLVVAHHCVVLGLLRQPSWPNLYHGAYLAVDLFFVLSGYVMTLAYGTWFVPGAWGVGQYAEFVLRRLARLWPLHATVLLTLLASAWVRGEWPFWPKMIAANALLIQGWGLSGSINPPSWSISTELAAYLLFPALAAAALHGHSWRAWFMAAAAAALLAAAVTLGPDAGGGRRGMLDLHGNWSVLPLLRCLGGFIAGLLLFRAVQDARIRQGLSRPWVAPAVAALVVAMVGVRAPDALAYLLLPILVASVHLGQGWFSRLLASPAPYWLGVLSYALYLLHYPLLAALPQSVLPHGLEFATALALCLGAACVAHVLVERPGRHAVTRLGALLRQSATAAT